MMDEERKLPGEWERDFGIKVADPDGWRNAGVPWSRELTRSEFNLLCAESTVNTRPKN